jgi:hypothetical protein
MALKMSPMRKATVVLPVPGAPVKHMWRPSEMKGSRPMDCRILSTTSMEASSRTRALTGLSPISSVSSLSSADCTPVPHAYSSALPT